MALRTTHKEAKKLGIPIPGARKGTKRRSIPGWGKGLFESLCDTFGLPRPIAEYRFHPTRKWKVDFAWPNSHPKRIALEIEGVSGEGTRHQRIAGFLNDIEKYNELTLAGFKLLRCTPRMVESGEVFALLRRAFGMEQEA